MTSLPRRLRDTRQLIETIDLQRLEQSVLQETQIRLVIVGAINSGKSTLFNQLKGQKLSKVSPVPGTTTEVRSEQFGPFSLVDTPGLGEAGDILHEARAREALQRASVAILVIDASAGIRQSDVALYNQLGYQGLTTVVVLNKIDLVGKDAQEITRNAEQKIRAPVIPISAKNGSGVSEALIPALIEAHPQMAVTIGRALPRYRKLASRRVIREAAIVGVAFAWEPVPGLDIPILIGIQLRMMLRLAAIYGEAITITRARELISAIAGGLAIRYSAQSLAKFIPVAGWVTSIVVWGSGTFALGNAAVAFFESKGKLTLPELREIYKRIRWKRQSDLHSGYSQLEDILTNEH